MNLTHHHLLKHSYWPAKASAGALTMMVGTVSWIHGYTWGGLLALLGGTSILAIFFCWTRDVLRESLHLGYHSENARAGATNGYLLFMLSECFFFGSFLWAYFFSALAPSIHIGGLWPATGIEAVNPWSIPLLNTIILLGSGATVTLAHNALLAGKKTEAWFGLLTTVILGASFSLLQILEYFEAGFTLADSVYGSVFFSVLSLHGAHVIIAVIYLWVCLKRVGRQEFTGKHLISLENALLLYHGVDVVWLIVFAGFYCWAS